MIFWTALHITSFRRCHITDNVHGHKIHSYNTADLFRNRGTRGNLFRLINGVNNQL
jgi:hypothetical protein